MTKQGAMFGQSSGEVLDLAAKSAASMTAASMLGVSMMTQAMGLWMGSVARLMEQAQKPAQVAEPDAAAKPASHETAVTAPKMPDDLKKISGIGPKMEQVLNKRGIATYADVAALNDDDVAGLEQSLGIEDRIGRDNWIAQASRLAAGN
ncbi:helix-hairpin-helix domain-containing protein [Tianweitania populi]|uniref:Helix-hairpin-helix domain-containing protein n=1 Tax=Tianweitania populi TaxID=1607949 RepID=A0A8J3DMT3_9HYPH|nr:helix-hairpin-helix domain-containing protein [Tianweitania populi]GHD07807.1 hypothetical protein GCM10016234_06650 [Tianweitania populi]